MLIALLLGAAGVLAQLQLPTTKVSVCGFFHTTGLCSSPDEDRPLIGTFFVFAF
jgi:hypothetical protein